MKKTLIAGLIAGVMGLGMVQAQAAELKIGYVNTQRIFRDAPAAVKAQKKLDSEFSRRDQDLQKMAKQLQSMQESLEKNGVTMATSTEVPI